MDEVIMIVGGGVALLAATAFGTMWWRERARRRTAEQQRFDDAVRVSGRFVLLQMRLEKREARLVELQQDLVLEQERRARYGRRSAFLRTRLVQQDVRWRERVAVLEGSLGLALQAFGRQADEAAQLARAWDHEVGRRRAAAALLTAVEALGVEVRWREEGEAYSLVHEACGAVLCDVEHGDSLDVLVGVARHHGGFACAPALEAVAS